MKSMSESIETVGESGDVTVSQNLEHSVIDYHIEDSYGEGMSVTTEKELRQLRDAIDETLNDDTVRINRLKLATLIDETRTVYNSMDDPEWRERYGRIVKEAIEAGEEALGHNE